MAKKFAGKDIKEVWDYRLSNACPFIERKGTWVVHICAKSNKDFNGNEYSKPLESHDTGIKTEINDANDYKKVAKCYEWLYSVRDKYSLPDIAKRKPLVSKINAANKAAAEVSEELAKMRTK
jgi:hypothetical protein